MKTTLRRLVPSVLLLFSTALLAQDGDAAGDRPKKDRDRPRMGDAVKHRTDWRERSHRLRGEFPQRAKRKWDPSTQFKGWLEQIKKEDPEKFEKLMKLRETNPDEFRKQISALARKRFQKRRLENMPPEERRCIELSRQYARTENPDEKAQIKAQLQEAVEKAFDARIRERLERLERMESELKRIRGQIEERKENRGRICTARVEELTRDPRLRWDW